MQCQGINIAVFMANLAFFSPICTERGINLPPAVHNRAKDASEDGMAFFIRFLTGFFVGLVLAGLLAALFMAILFC